MQHFPRYGTFEDVQRLSVGQFNFLLAGLRTFYRQIGGIKK